MGIESARTQLKTRISTVSNASFDALALDVFRFQASRNAVYQEYLQLIHKDPAKIKKVDDIPFLPIQFFKNYALKTGVWVPETAFTSSGTTGTTTSTHWVRDLDWYRTIARQGFEHFYGSISNYCVLALLPAYLERSGSSLVFMADDFIKQSKFNQSGFFLNNLEELVKVIRQNLEENTPTLLLGVSFALWELAESFPQNFEDLMIMETGGMKGRRKEIIRTELHQILTSAFKVNSIHSEYGMTELFSQAYSKGAGIFYPAPTMKVTARQVTDPFSHVAAGKTGVLNIIDLANLDTVSFIATEDLGKVYPDGSFEVLGRLDTSDLRGCNLLVS